LEIKNNIFHYKTLFSLDSNVRQEFDEAWGDDTDGGEGKWSTETENEAMALM